MRGCIGSVRPRPPLPRSIDKVSIGARGVHQATAPSTQLVGCDGDWPAYRSKLDFGWLEITGGKSAGSGADAGTDGQRQGARQSPACAGPSPWSPARNLNNHLGRSLT